MTRVEECVSRRAVDSLIWKYLRTETDEHIAFYEHFLDLPSVTPQEPRKGHWIADVDRWGDVVTTVNGYKCDKCNAFNSDKDNYCPNCGAKMLSHRKVRDK